MVFGKVSVTVAFQRATVYDISRFDVMEGEVFELVLNGFQSRVKWFSDNDPVLDVRTKQDTHSAYCKATAVGKSTVLIVSRGFVKKVVINVVPAMAATLGVQVSKPQDK